MNEKYYGLEIDKVINDVCRYTNFSLSHDYLQNMDISFNPLVIERLINQSKEALETTIKYGSMPFFGIKDISQILHGCIKGQTLFADQLLDVVSINTLILTILKYTKQFENKYPNLMDLVDTLQYHDEINIAINKAINQYGEVKDDASTTLLNLKRKLYETDATITSSITKFMKENSDSLQEQIISYRHDRACLLVKSSLKYSFKGYVHGDSASKLASYVEPDFLVSLNSKKIMLLDDIEEEIKRILEELSVIVRKYAKGLLENLDTLCLLDVIYAKALYGKNNNGILAEVSNSRHFYLKDARHPLIDQTKVKSNTYDFNEDINCVLITGSNTGGKTVSLKLIGLCVLMTYLGIPVLCEEAKIPLFDEIYEDITDDQSIIESLSTFSSHLKKLAHITNNATKNSLILLDEIGSGTDPKDGESLAISILDYLRNKGSLSICTTHYGRLKAYGSKHKDILLGSVEFDPIKLMPTYRFIQGVVGQSNAFEIMRQFDFDSDIINNAIDLSKANKSIDEELIEKLNKQLEYNRIEKERVEALISEYETKNKKLEERLDRLKEKENEVLNDAQNKANELLEEKLSEADKIIKELRENSNAKIHESLNIRKKIKDLQATEETKVNPLDEPIKVGDYVIINKTNQRGEVIELRNNNATVLFNGIRINTKLNGLTKTINTNTIKVQPKPKRHEFKANSMSPECYLIGMTYVEAEEELIKYIDKALVNNLKNFRIIHGHGTGVLRKMVHDHLRKLPYVKDFHLATADVGGTGATVVELK